MKRPSRLLGAVLFVATALAVALPAVDRLPVAAATAPPLPAGAAGPIQPPALQTSVPEPSASPGDGPTPHITPPPDGANTEPFSGATGRAAATVPPLAATATPSPSGKLVRYTGQILDDRGGFVFFTTGDAFRLAPGLKLANAAGTGPTALVPRTRVFARASFDTGNGSVVQLDLSTKRLPAEASYEAIKGFAIALSTSAPNPDLRGGIGFSGKPVLVTFKVRVPTRTPFTDDVFLATSASNWSATEIKMDRVDALNYATQREYPAGTTFEYRYTRGSWNSAERGQDGLEDTHKLTVNNADTQNRNDIVYSWGDENPAANDLGNGIPTPFNNIPFSNLPPH